MSATTEKAKSPIKKQKQTPLDTDQIEFNDNALSQLLYGPQAQNLLRLAEGTGTEISSRGSIVVVRGAPQKVSQAKTVLSQLYARLRDQEIDRVDVETVDAAIRLSEPDEGNPWDDPAAPKTGMFGGSELVIQTKKRRISPRSKRQKDYVKAMLEHELVFGVGPAGTGKTYLAVAMAVQMLTQGQVDRIVLSRPAVEAGEHLGFLPGDLKDKVDPYLRPLYDALHDTLPGDVVIKRMERGEIEVAPLAFMRGRTLSHAFVILDEAQNTTPMQMKMFLTRLGEGSRMVVTGDITQIDLPSGVKSGLRDAMETLDKVEGVGRVKFDQRDVVRHAMVTRIVQAYDEADALRERIGKSYSQGHGDRKVREKAGDDSAA
ncbi:MULTISPECIES: PhoH family protein [unclassified Thalassospira]|uniref:PhoH family protein n=1 Tax=unclassified Thalassospira TaxID=2648997 RepID=UPI000A1D63ED|nr:PhoH family protein [Thalassospira sp. MCCC 1A01428]OSQ45870.1 PhoH [Thalassospira sp. MCCC 1A01428]